jgi:hypothetical protein
MILFIDNDALLKLVSYDLLETALAMFHIRQEDVRVLATAKYALLPANNRLRRCKTEQCATRLESFLPKATKLSADDADAAALDALAEMPGIDAGEALMFAVAAPKSDSFIITGDKRALEALQIGQSHHGVRDALAGRVLSIELLFSFMVEGDFAQLQAQVRSQPGVDTALSSIFGVSVPASPESVRAALDSYIGHLRHRTGTLLHPSPTSF